MRNTSPRTACVLLFLWILASPVLLGEIPPMTDEERTAKADHIVLAVPISSTVEARTDEDFVHRTMTFRIKVEETEKGEPVRGDVIEIQAWTSEWIGEGRPPTGASGHRPLPVEGELARFHLAKVDDNGRYPILIPNGVERGDNAGPTPSPAWESTGAASETSLMEAEDDGSEPSSKDPFGWDVILVLLAVPILVGSFRQSGTPRWVLMSIATVMMVTALITALFG